MTLQDLFSVFYGFGTTFSVRFVMSSNLVTPLRKAGVSHCAGSLLVCFKSLAVSRFTVFPLVVGGRLQSLIVTFPRDLFIVLFSVAVCSV